MNEDRVESVQFSVVAPHLYFGRHQGDYAIYVGLRPEQVIPVSRDVGRTAARRIGTLLVYENNMNGVEIEVTEGEPKTPLDVYLDALEKQNPSLKRRLADSTRFYRSESVDPQDVQDWFHIRHNFSDPDMALQASREEVMQTRKRYRALDKSLPVNDASLRILAGSKNFLALLYLGNIKEDGKPKLEEAAAEIIEVLKNSSGVALSPAVLFLASQTFVPTYSSLEMTKVWISGAETPESLDRAFM